MLLFSNPPSISLVICITGRFVDGVFMKLVDVWIASVFSSLLVMFISRLESFWILLKFCLSGSWMVFPLSWLLVDKGNPCTETVEKRKFISIRCFILDLMCKCVTLRD